MTRPSRKNTLLPLRWDGTFPRFRTRLSKCAKSDMCVLPISPHLEERPIGSPHMIFDVWGWREGGLQYSSLVMEKNAHSCANLILFRGRGLSINLVWRPLDLCNRRNRLPTFDCHHVRFNRSGTSRCTRFPDTFRRV